MTLKADLDALAGDAGMWSKISGTLETAADNTAYLDLSDSELSWAAGETGLTAVYTSYVAAVEALLRGGATETDRMADTLLEIKKDYETTDDISRSRYAGLWDPASA